MTPQDQPTKSRQVHPLHLSTFLVLAAVSGAQTPQPANVLPDRPPRTHVERLIERLLPCVVKVHGASGVASITGYGSGCLVSPQGHVLTVDHVMLQPEQTKVVLADGTVLPAAILQRDDKHGVAMLKVEPPVRDGKPMELPFLKVPESVELWPGRVVVSLGNAFRLAEFGEKVSATIGVVTAKVRMDLRFRLQRFSYPGEVIITDAPNNPGAFGGGLFTLDGTWVGLNGPLVESTETNTAISLAFPTPDLRAFIARATGDLETARRLESAAEAASVKKGPVRHGIRLFDSGLRRSPPAYVETVESGSPAAKVGIRADDLIVRLNDFPVGSCAEFHRVMKSFAPDEKIDVTLKRGSEVMKIEMTLEALSEGGAK